MNIQRCPTIPGCDAEGHRIVLDGRLPPNMSEVYEILEAARYKDGFLIQQDAGQTAHCYRGHHRHSGQEVFIKHYQSSSTMDIEK